MPFERSVWVDMTLYALLAFTASLDPPLSLASIAVPRWGVFRTPPPKPAVRIETKYVDDERPRLQLAAVVTRDTDGGFARGTLCILSTRLEVDDLRQAAESGTPVPCTLDISCGMERLLNVPLAECNVTRATGRAAEKMPYLLSSEDGWGSCNERTWFEVDGRRNRITIDHDDLENLSKPERHSLELAIIGGVAAP